MFSPCPRPFYVFSPYPRRFDVVLCPLHHRVAEFQNALKEAFRAIRRESGTFDEIMAHVNSGRANPFTEAEAEAVLVGLEQQNRIFYRDRNVFLI